MIRRIQSTGFLASKGQTDLESEGVPEFSVSC